MLAFAVRGADAIEADVRAAVTSALTERNLSALQAGTPMDRLADDARNGSEPAPASVGAAMAGRADDGVRFEAVRRVTVHYSALQVTPRIRLFASPFAPSNSTHEGFFF
jgi:hypothetical protein